MYPISKLPLLIAAAHREVTVFDGSRLPSDAWLGGDAFVELRYWPMPEASCAALNVMRKLFLFVQPLGTTTTFVGGVGAVVSSSTTVNWFDKAMSRARGALQLVHGVTAGNIVQIDAPAVEIGKVSQGNTQGIINYSLPLSLCADAGNDELTITVM